MDEKWWLATTVQFLWDGSVSIVQLKLALFSFRSLSLGELFSPSRARRFGSHREFCSKIQLVVTRIRSFVPSPNTKPPKSKSGRVPAATDLDDDVDFSDERREKRVELFLDCHWFIARDGDLRDEYHSYYSMS